MSFATPSGEVAKPAVATTWREVFAGALNLAQECGIKHSNSGGVVVAKSGVSDRHNRDLYRVMMNQG